MDRHEHIRNPNHLLTKAGVILGIGIAALTLTACGENTGATGPEPTISNSAEPEQHLTCEEFAATLDIPEVDSEAGEAFIKKHTISGDVKANELSDRVSDLFIGWVTSGLGYLPTDRKTMVDCTNKAGTSSDKFGDILGLDKLSDLFLKAVVSKELHPDTVQVLSDSAKKYLYEIAYNHMLTLYVKDGAVDNEITENVPREYNVRSIQDDRVSMSTYATITVGGEYGDEFEIPSGGVWELDKTLNEWHWVAAS